MNHSNSAVPRVVRPFKTWALPGALKTTLLALCLAGAWYWLQGDILINLADEGFLWYGTGRTLLGDIPLRDFQSYDPGRYYWGAGWFRILGNHGILALRLSTWAFGAIGLAFGLLVLKRVIRSWAILTFSGILLLLWMYPWYKIFEQGITLAGIYFAVLLLERPSRARHFAAGAFVGMAAFFGRNHGVYGLISFLALIVLIWIKFDRKDLVNRLGFWGAGILVGFSPMLLMMVFSPGFFESFWHSILVILRLGGTNLHLPVPWPWKTGTWGPGILGGLEGFSTGLLFLALPLFYGAGALFVLFSRGSAVKERAPLAACVVVGAVYMHYVFSRADLDHLALGIHPMLMGLLFLPFWVKDRFLRKGAAIILGLVVAASVFSVGMASPLYIGVSGQRGGLQEVEIRGDKIQVCPYTAGLIRAVKRISDRTVGPCEKLFIAPHWTTFYSILGRKAPLWDIYLLFRETEARQKEMIRELDKKKVNWAILGDVALDGRDELRLRNTHPLLWSYFMYNFTPVPAEGLPRNYLLLRRK